MIEISSHPTPKGKIVSLFVTCMVDMLTPATGMSVVNVLEHLGCTVVFPTGQTCCGQPGFNAGYWPEARQVALHFLDVFDSAEIIVAPSGSCVSMVRHEYPKLFADDPINLPRAQRLASITWEFSEFIVNGLGISDLNAHLPQPQTFAFHDACHGLRQLKLHDQARQLIGAIDNADLTELNEHDVCCGFGGLFSVKMAAISGSMLKQKTANIKSCPAQVLCGDVSCMTHINGGLARQGSDKRVRHIADILAEAIKNKPVEHK